MPVPETRSVLIPIHVANDSAGVLLHVIARDLGPHASDARAEGAHPAIAGLHYRFARAGEAALGAVARLQLRPRPLLGGWLGGAHTGPQAALTAVNGQDLKGLTAENSASAELGFSLALVMQEARSRARLVYATGAVDRGTSLSGVTSRSVAVLPVEHLAEKMAGIAASLDTASPAAGSSEAHLFLPAVTRDGRATATALQTEIAALIAAFAAHGLTLAVHPVATLEAALDVLGIRRLPRPARERAIVAGAGTLCALAIATFAAWWWLTAPVGLAFGRLEFGDSGARQTPLAAKLDPAGVLRPVRACLGPENMPLYRPGQQIVFRVDATDESALVRRLGGTRFAVIGLSERSGVREWPEELISRGGGAPLDVQIPVAEGEPETNYIVVVARRVRGFGGFAFRDEIRAVMAKAPDGEKINAALGYLAKRAPGHITYKLATAGDDQPCRE